MDVKPGVPICPHGWSMRSTTVSNSPFVPSKGTNCILPGLVNCNFIIYFDGEGRSTSPVDHAAVDRQTFELEPILTPPTRTPVPPPSPASTPINIRPTSCRTLHPVLCLYLEIVTLRG